MTQLSRAIKLQWGSTANLLSITPPASQHPMSPRSQLSPSSLSWRFAPGLRGFLGHRTFGAKTGTVGHLTRECVYPDVKVGLRCSVGMPGCVEQGEGTLPHTKTPPAGLGCSGKFSNFTESSSWLLQARSIWFSRSVVALRLSISNQLPQDSKAAGFRLSLSSKVLLQKSYFLTCLLCQSQLQTFYFFHYSNKAGMKTDIEYKSPPLYP